MTEFKSSSRGKLFLSLSLVASLLFGVPASVDAWVAVPTPRILQRPFVGSGRASTIPLLLSSSSSTEEKAVSEPQQPESPFDYEVPEDAVIIIKPKAMNRLRELRDKQNKDGSDLILRMGVRSGGCSGMSYVMDFSTEDGIQDDDAVDEYTDERIRCVVDAKSMLYLYGLELDYSDELIGGGFKFSNPNAEASCGCGSSFGV